MKGDEDSFVKARRQDYIKNPNQPEPNLVIKTRARSISPTQRCIRLSGRGKLDAILRKQSSVEHDDYIDNESKSSRLRSREPSPCYQRLAEACTKATQLRFDEVKENKRNRPTPKLSLPRVPSPCCKRLAGSPTKATKLRYEEMKENKRNFVCRPLPPRAPSPCHERLAVSSTRATELRIEETKETQRSLYKRKKNEMRFYRTSPARSLSSDHSRQTRSGSPYDTSTISSFSSFGESEELSYHKDQLKSNSTSFPYDTKKGVKLVPNHYDRLATTNTRNMQLRRQVEKELHQKKKSNSRNNSQSRAAFNCYLSKSNSTLNNRRQSASPGRRVSHSPKTKRSLQSPYSATTDTYTPALKKALSQSKVSSSKSSRTKADLDVLFHRLSKQDTIASSRKTNGMRPILLTPYEKMQRMKQTKIREEKKKVRTSRRFFNELHKGVTMSMLYKEYDEAMS